MNQNCMITREAALEFGLSFQEYIYGKTFPCDQNWQVVRARETKKFFYGSMNETVMLI